MRVLFSAIVLALGISTASLAQDQTPPRTITVNESAEVAAVPDRARLSISVISKAKEAQAAAAANASAATNVVNVMKESVGDSGRVKTGSYSLRADYEFHRRGETPQRTLIGYVASNQVTVTTTDLAAAGSLIDAAVKAGANEVGQIEFFLSDRQEVETQATLEAGRRARAKAETLAESLGVGLGQLLEASTNTSGGGGRVMARSAFMEGSADAATPVEAGEVRVQASVSARFEIR